MHGRISFKIAVTVGAAVLTVVLGHWTYNRHAAATRRAAIRPQGMSISGPNVPRLHFDTVVEHGHIIEIQGTTEPGASVMINGEPVPVIFEGATFRYFVGPLPTGLTVLTISAQTEDGGVNTQRAAVEVH